MPKTLSILVKPNARHQKISIQPSLDGNDVYIASVKAPPIDGKANKELIHLLAEYFSVPKKYIQIRTGRTGKYKIVHVWGEKFDFKSD